MTAATVLTMANGKGIDLTDPKPDDIDFSVIAEHLAKENRYNGATPRQKYTVAQHCVIGADQAFEDTGNAELAGYFLLHDGHEAFLKDDTTPKKRALAEVAAHEFGVLAEEILSAFDMLVERFDVAIHAAAGLDWPPPPAIKGAVKAYDLMMFVTEWRDLMRGVPHPDWEPYRHIDPIPREIVPWSWHQSAKAYEARCRLYLPAFAKAHTPTLVSRIAEAISRSGAA